MYTTKRSIVFECPMGLYMRPAEAIAQLVDKHDAVVTIRKSGDFASAASITDLMSLNVGSGESLALTAIGRDAEKVLEAIPSLLHSFSEKGHLSSCSSAA